MNVEEIRTVGVVGAGSMGAGIIQVAAQAGFEVKAVDVDDAACTRAAKSMARLLDRLIAKEKITEAEKNDGPRPDQLLHRRRDAPDVPVLIEAVFENVEVKRRASRASSDLPRRRHLRDQHLVPFRSPRSPPPCGGPRRASACTSSTPFR